MKHDMFYLFSPVYLALTLAIVIYLNSNKNNRSKRCLSFLLFDISLLFFGLVFFFIGDHQTYSLLLSSNVASMLLVYPLFYIYVDLLINQGRIRQYYKHLLPAVVSFVITSIFMFLFLNGEQRISFLTSYRYNPVFHTFGLTGLYIIRIINITLLFAQIIYYGVVIAKRLNKYRQEINNNFSNTEGIQLNSTRTFNVLLIIVSFASIAFYSVNPIKLFNSQMVVIVPLILISVIICAVGMSGIRQKAIPIMKTIEKEVVVETDRYLHELLQAVHQYFEKHKPYLNPDLKMEDVEKEIGTNRSYLSASINKGGDNFNTFVNRYRVEESIRILNETSHKSACDIYYRAGFGSISSFNRSFLKETGLSFNKYINCRNQRDVS